MPEKSAWLSLGQDRLGKQLLDKENHKFQYKEVEKGGRAQKYYSSIEWLLTADIITTARLVTYVMYDLDDYARDDFFRAYTTDLSLLIAIKDFGLKQHIIEFHDGNIGTAENGIVTFASFLTDPDSHQDQHQRQTGDLIKKHCTDRKIAKEHHNVGKRMQLPIPDPQ